MHFQLTQETFEAIYKNLKDGIALLDTQTTLFLDLNQAFADMTGYTIEELLHTSCFKLSVDQERSKDAIEKVKKNGSITNFIKQYIKKNGVIITINMSISLINDGKIMLVSVRDITTQKELETKFLEEKNKAQEASKAKSTFLANMSHEIRTPLNGIIGMSHLVLQTNLNERQNDYIQKINNSGKILLNIINKTLDFSKIEAGKLSIEGIEFNLFQLIENVVNLIEYEAREKNLKLIVSYGTQVGKNFIGDSLRISQVLINLAANAVKFTQLGEISIYVDKIQEHRYRFTVKDSGIGMSKMQQEKLFQPFSQTNDSTPRKYGGTGLGLTISKQLVELMGGRIWCESELDKGSSFIFELNLKEVNHPHDPFKTFIDKMEEEQSQKYDISVLAESNILLVEDNRINQEIIVGLLEESGINLDIANNGKEALHMCKYTTYELILMDIQMPVMNGYEATQAIRQNNTTIPIIALTASAMQEDIERTKDAGMNEHLNKPIEVEKLYKTLLKYLSNK